MNIDPEAISRKHQDFKGLKVPNKKTSLAKVMAVMTGLGSAAVAVVVGAGVILGGMQANQTDQAQAAQIVSQAATVDSQTGQANVAAHSTKTLHAANAVQPNIIGTRNNNFISSTHIDSVLLKENSLGAIQGIIKVDLHIDEQAMQKYFHDQALVGDKSFSAGDLNVDLNRSKASVNQYVQKHMDAVHATVDNLKNGVKVNASAEDAVLFSSGHFAPFMIQKAVEKANINMSQSIESGYKAGYAVHLASDNMYTENLIPYMQGKTPTAIANADIYQEQDLALNLR